MVKVTTKKTKSARKKKMTKVDKSKIMYKGLAIVLVTILLLGVSYAWLTLTLNSSKSNVLTAGKLSVTLNDTQGNGITLTDVVPVLDEVGLKYVPYTFTLTNNGTIDSEYTLYLDDIALEGGETKLADNYIKYNLTKDGTSLNTALLTTTGTNPNRVLDTGVIKAGASYSYDLRLWLDENTTIAQVNKIFRGKIRVEAIQAERDEYVKDGLVLWYDGINKGDIAGKWKDLSGNGNDGTLSGFNNNEASGFTGNSLKFDGVDDKVNVNALTLDNYTVQFVVKITKNQYNGLLMDATKGTYALALGPQSNNNALYYFNANYSNGVASFGPSLNLIKSASFVRRSSALREVYNNTTKVGINGTSTSVFPTNALEVGNCYWGYLQGDLYSVRIYNRDLTPEEINQNYKMDKIRYGVQ